MKYSLRSLMIVVTLAAIVSALVARSRHCAERAAFHKGHVSEDALKELRAAEITYGKKLSLCDWMMFHKKSAAAYERVSKMPWLPLSLSPEPPTPGDPNEELAVFTTQPLDPKEEAEKEHALDALRTKFAKESREKYGVP